RHGRYAVREQEHTDEDYRRDRRTGRQCKYPAHYALFHSARSAQLVISPVKTLVTCSLVIPVRVFSLFTITAMPSMAMVVGTRPASSSESFSARLAMPMSHTPFMALFMPVVESLCCSS